MDHRLMYGLHRSMLFGL